MLTTCLTLNMKFIEKRYTKSTLPKKSGKKVDPIDKKDRMKITFH